MIINPIEITTKDDQVIVQSLIQYSRQEKILWYSFDDRYKDYLSTELLDGFLVGVLMLAMKLGEDIIVRGAVSEKLLYNLTNYYMNIVKIIIPSLTPIKIITESVDYGIDNERGCAVVTGFSGGVDSFSTIFDHINKDTPDNYRITHFIFNNVGAVPEDLFHERYDLIKGFANEIGVEFVKVDSNLSGILDMNFAQVHVPCNVSSVLLLQQLFGKYYYASGVGYQDSFIGKAQDIAYSDAASLHLLSTERLECISSGGQYTRVEKTRNVVKVESAARWLNVCASPGTNENCSVCWKCCRTLFTLELLGEVDKFGDVFNLRKFDGARQWYIVDTVLNPKKKDDPLTKEIRELAEAVGYHFKLHHRVLSFVVGYTPASIYQKIRQLSRPE